MSVTILESASGETVGTCTGSSTSDCVLSSGEGRVFCAGRLLEDLRAECPVTWEVSSSADVCPLVSTGY